MWLIPYIHGPALGLLLTAFGIAIVVGCLKGRYALSILGVLVLAGVPSLLAACRLARADSWWARRFYGDDQLGRVAHRYPGNSGINDALTL